MSAEEAKRRATAAGMAIVQDLLPLLVLSARKRAQVPILDFQVGAVGLGASGRVNVGVNLEFRGVPLCHSVHAEQFLVANAAAAGELALRAVVVSHMPCGHCRQFLQEIRGAAGIQIPVTSDSDDGCAPEWRTVASLLLRPFGPHDLLDENVPLVLEPHDNALGDPVPTAVAANGFAPGDLDACLRDAVEAAARAAHAPYSQCPSGFVVADGDGRIYAGGCLESAAYNPTLGPVHAAIIAMVAAGGGPAGDVVAAALVKRLSDWLHEAPWAAAPGPGAWSKPTPSRAARPASGEPATRAPHLPVAASGVERAPRRASHHHQGKSRTLLV